MLYVTGYVKDWYTYRAIDDDKIELIIDICSVSNSQGHRVVMLDDTSMLERMRKVSKRLFCIYGK